jgi:DNA-binding IscR family transcriptional regulator
MVNSKLTVGVHILALLAMMGETQLTSEQIAGSVNTNPVVIRRLLGLLRTAGYVESTSGPGGG